MKGTLRFIGVLVGVLLIVYIPKPLHLVANTANAQGHNNKCRIMPLGDSITFDNAIGETADGSQGRPVTERAGFRKHLWESLLNTGYQVDFVGSEKAGQGFDIDNAGFPDITMSRLADLLKTGTDPGDSPLPGDDRKVTDGPYLETFPANIILLHIGTKSIQRKVGQPFNDLLNENRGHLRRILNEIDRVDKGTKVILARIINRRVCSVIPTAPDCDINRTSTTRFNHEVVETIAKDLDPSGEKIIVVDMENVAGFQYDEMDMFDDLNPNEAGYQKMAVVWMDGLGDMLPNCPSGQLNTVPPAPPTNLRIIH